MPNKFDKILKRIEKENERKGMQEEQAKEKAASIAGKIDRAVKEIETEEKTE